MADAREQESDNAVAHPAHARVDPDQVPEVESQVTPVAKAGIGDVHVTLPHENAAEKDGGSRSRKRTVVAAVLVVTLLVAAAVFITYKMEVWGGKSVPYLMGSTQQEAKEAIEAKGLVAKFVEQQGDETSGLVLSTDPVSGTRLDVGSTITVTVSAKRSVPKVIGLSEDEAKQALKKAGAKDIRVVSKASDAPEGSVTAVDPAEGSEFTSQDLITLTVAKTLVVPKLVGLSEDEATKTLENAGLVAKVTYVKQRGDSGTVVSCSPEEGSQIGGGSTVTISVISPYPSDWRHVSEYFGHNSTTIASYLSKRGFSLVGSYSDSDGYALALYEAQGKGHLLFTSTPWSGAFDKSKATTGEDALGDGMQFMGLRLELANVGADATRAGVTALAKSCGLSDPSDICTQDDVVLPDSADASSKTFCCASGDAGQCYWTVLVESGSSGNRAVITCASKDCYRTDELSAFGGSVCDFMAGKYVYGIDSK